jgi:peptidoglycan/LPS O-acetylase OafA/YrhL
MSDINLTSILLVALLTICIFVTAHFTVKIKDSQLYDSLNRSSPIDAMRGILALSVMTHHFYITYVWKTQGVWQKPSTLFLDNLGAVAVSLFFLTTGFLFLNKLQKKTIDWEDLYWSRLKRIVPLFVFVVFIVLVITFSNIERSILDKKSLGFIIKWFLFLGGDLDSFESKRVIAGVHWSLVYEWGFYFALPFIYTIVNKSIPNRLFLVVFAIPLVYILTVTNLKLYLLFALSYLSILFKNQIKYTITKYKKISSIAILFIFIYTLLYTEGYSITQQIFISIIFAFIANGLTLSILKNNGLKILGDISYSIYLMHGIVLYSLFSILDVFNFQNTIYQFLTYYPLAFILTILISFFTHKHIEKRFLRLTYKHIFKNL